MKQDEEIRKLNAKIDHAELLARNSISQLEVPTCIYCVQLFVYYYYYYYFCYDPMVNIICRLLSLELRGMNWKI